jgi:hypothetical protein
MPIHASQAMVAQRAPMTANLQQRQRALAPQVGAAAQHILAMLNAYGPAAYARINGGWGDVAFRMAGVDHQLVGIALFPKLFDVWQPGLANVMSTWVWESGVPQLGPVSEGEWALWPMDEAHYAIASAGMPIEGGTPTGFHHGPRDPHFCDWNQNPEAFADQIELVRANLEANVRQYDWTATPAALPWHAEQSPPSASATLAPYVEALQSQVAQYLSDALGVDYSVPVIGWAIAVIDLIIQVLYWIFGTASGVETPPVPLQEGEHEGWLNGMATTIVALQLLDEECRRLTVFRNARPFAASATAFHPSPTATATATATRNRQLVAVALGTGAALALVWALMA